MSDKEKAALALIERFATSQGGGGKIYKHDSRYRYRAANGRVAVVGWE